MKTLARFGFSSLAATAVDGVVYQLALLVASNRYVFAAYLAAACGAVTGFTLARQWVFMPAADNETSFAFGLGSQAALYVATSALCAAVVAGSLWTLVEFGRLGARIAWFPAKLIAWGLVSFPLQRSVVFRSRP